jgi:hypothetical protein
MSGYRLGHDLDDDPELYAGHVLDEVPLVFEDGEAIAEDRETARALARRHTHVHIIGAVQEADSDDAVDDDDEGAEEFDASEFVDRTPMSDVVEDLESGDYDDHLDAIDEVAEREGVKDAVDARREA